MYDWFKTLKSIWTNGFHYTVQHLETKNPRRKIWRKLEISQITPANETNCWAIYVLFISFWDNDASKRSIKTICTVYWYTQESLEIQLRFLKKQQIGKVVLFIKSFVLPMFSFLYKTQYFGLKNVVLIGCFLTVFTSGKIYILSLQCFKNSLRTQTD